MAKVNVEKGGGLDHQSSPSHLSHANCSNNQCSGHATDLLTTTTIHRGTHPTFVPLPGNIAGAPKRTLVLLSGCSPTFFHLPTSTAPHLACGTLPLSWRLRLCGTLGLPTLAFQHSHATWAGESASSCRGSRHSLSHQGCPLLTDHPWQNTHDTTLLRPSGSSMGCSRDSVLQCGPRKLPLRDRSNCSATMLSTWQTIFDSYRGTKSLPGSEMPWLLHQDHSSRVAGSTGCCPLVKPRPATSKITCRDTTCAGQRPDSGRYIGATLCPRPLSSAHRPKPKRPDPQSCHGWWDRTSKMDHPDKTPPATCGRLSPPRKGQHTSSCDQLLASEQDSVHMARAMFWCSGQPLEATPRTQPSTLSWFPTVTCWVRDTTTTNSETWLPLCDSQCRSHHHRLGCRD